MKKLVYALACLAVVTLFISVGTAKAQGFTAVKTWDFESTMENWASGAGGASIALSTDQAHGGTHSLKMVKSTTSTEINLQNDVYKPQQGDSLSAWVRISTADLAYLNGFQVFWQDGSGWTWHSKWINGTALTGDAWNQVGVTFPAITSPLQRIGLQFTGKSGTTANTPTMYVDDITIYRVVGDTTLVSNWGSVGGRTGGTAKWKISTGTPGNAGTFSDKVPAGQWATICGGFYGPLTATTTQAFVVTGSVEFVGSGPVTWSGLRYGLFRFDSLGTLLYAGTDSARWSGKENFAYGYMFTPQSGTTYVGNIPGGTNASQGMTTGGSWVSTYGGAVGFGGLIQQAPARAIFDAGKYDWAISVQPLADNTNQVRFYMIKQAAAGQQSTYWYGGTLIDPSGITKKFNAVAFGLDPNYDQTTSPISAMNLSSVQIKLGAPITVPEPPFVAFYLQDWGAIGNRTGGTGNWKIVPSGVNGNCSIASNKVPAGQWATIRGGFLVPVTATTSKAIIVTGSVEFVGSGPVTWSGLRYGLFRHDSVGTVQYANTDTARWGTITSGVFKWGLENYAYGYMFTPQSGTTYVGTIPGGTNASQGITTGGSWVSTYGGAVGFGGLIQQQPARAIFDAGKYDWAISVQPQADGTHEVRFYMIKQAAAGQQSTYWYGGTLIDPLGITKTFNGICFGLDPNYDQTTSPISALNLTDVKVDLGNPITVPESPFAAYYLSDWGFYGRTAGWTFTPGVIGNGTISGDTTNADVSSVRAGFVSPLALKSGKALTVTGKVEFVGGGFEAPGAFRCGIFYSGNPGTVASNVWSGTERLNYGYLFLPPSGSNGPVDWAGTPGTWGGIIGGIWRNPGSDTAYVLGTDLQSPAKAVGGAGVYNFTISISPAGTGKNEVSFSLVKADNSYSFTVKKIDVHSPLASSKFNCVAFTLHHENITTATVNFTDVKVDLVDHIVKVKEAPVATIPTEYALSQNYPNPFNPSTTIGYDIPKSSRVSVKIYDVLGRLVATLVDGVQSPSSYRVEWNPSGLSSGVYFYRIQAQGLDGSGDFTAVKKLLLTK